MKPLIKLAAILVALSFAIPAAAAIVIPQYTVIPLVLDNQVSSRTSRPGDRFFSHCAGANCGGFPQGTTFVGVITEARPMQPGYPGHLNAAWIEAILPNGRRVPISAALSTAQGSPKGPIQGSKAKSGTKKKGAIIGGAIGLIAGGFEGLILGGASGYGAGAAVQGKTTDITAKPGTQYYIVLTKPATIPTRR